MGAGILVLLKLCQAHLCTDIASAKLPLAYTAPRGRFIVTGIRHTAVLVLGCLLLALALSACGGTPEPAADIDATVEARVQAVAKATALSIPTVTPVPTVAPITIATLQPVPPTVTPAADELEEDVTCTLKRGEVVQKGWSGKDTGSNYCNQCMCLNAGLACTKMACPSVKLPAALIPVPPTVATAPIWSAVDGG